MPAAIPASQALCFICASPGALQCAKWNFIRYCGKDLQTQDWKNHKLSCKPTVPEHFLVKGIPRMDPNRDDFKGLPKQFAYAKLCDAFRMRVEDMGMFNGNLMRFAMGNNPYTIKSFVDKAGLQEVWGMNGPMQLRMLGEMIYGTHVMGGGPMKFQA